MTEHSLCRQFQITRQEIETRRAFLGFTALDEENLERIRSVVEGEADSLVEDFYAHLLGFAELNRFLSDKPTLDRLKGTLKQYLLNLGRGSDSDAYFEERLRIGLAHERVGLKQKWYLGAYAKLFDAIAPRLAGRYGQEPERLSSLLITLQKTLTLDSILAVETYYNVMIRRLEDALAELTEAQHDLQRTSRLDGLTKIDNRMALVESVEMEFHRSRRFAHPFNLLFLDIDLFKNLNDQYGHAFGDFVLTKVVELIYTVIRTTDITGRYGGDEFAIGLVECPADAARTIAERIRLKVALAPFEFEDKSASVTVSIGVAALTPEVEQAETLLARADQAMYQAKQAGRNCVSVHP